MKYSSGRERLSVSWEGEEAAGLRAQRGSPRGLDPGPCSLGRGQPSPPLPFPPPSHPPPSHPSPLPPTPPQNIAHTVPAELLVGSAEQELQACCTGMLWLRRGLCGEGCNRSGDAS